MDPNFSDAACQFIAENADVLTEGYTTTAEHKHGADYHWVCKQCYEDFADMFEWRIERTG